MKKIMIVFMLLFSSAAFAEHDATYCGKILAGKTGKFSWDNSSPEVIIAVEYRLYNSVLEEWDRGYGAVDGLTPKQSEFAAKAVKSSKTNGTLFCVKARWGGAAYSSTNLKDLTLSTDSVIRIDYLSSFKVQE